MFYHSSMDSKDKKLLVDKPIEKTNNESAENADFFVDLADIPDNLPTSKELDFALRPSTKEDSKYKAKSDEELQQILTNSYKFDHREKSFLPFALSILLIGLFYQLNDNNLNATFDTAVADKNNPITYLVFSGIISYIDILKILTPLWITIIFRYFPFTHDSVYMLKFNYLYIETFNAATYKQNIQRVRVPWNRIAKVEFKQGKLFPYIDLYDERRAHIATIRWDFKDMDKVKKGVKFFTDNRHPLHQFVDSIKS